MYVDDQTTGLLDAEQHYRNAQSIRHEFYQELGQRIALLWKRELFNSEKIKLMHRVNANG
tara:strand:+ start:7085 stop:7264 length:180 start_codon:yes stop_codon:yes gene_type:complete